jgi:pimeloyl-ACP methyl ester carboxylesterase
MRDLTPPSQVQQQIDVYPTLGGADQFLRFIVEELKPLVDARYRTNGYSIVVGHSLGGLFVLHALVTQPGSFNSYVAIDPSLWWNDQALVRQADAFIESDPELNTSLYLIVGNGQGPGLDAALELAGMLDRRRPSGLRSDFTRIATESHDTVALLGIYQGLRWIFANWDIGDEASALFGDSPAEDMLRDIDDLYRRSGEQLGFERETPYFVYEGLLNYLALNSRLDEAATLTLRESNRYPLLPYVISGITGMYVSSGNTDAAIAYLSEVLEVFPYNDAARRLLDEMGVESTPDR